jgi:hypothetical protein
MPIPACSRVVSSGSRHWLGLAKALANSRFRFTFDRRVEPGPSGRNRSSATGIGRQGRRNCSETRGRQARAAVLEDSPVLGSSEFEAELARMCWSLLAAD